MTPISFPGGIRFFENLPPVSVLTGAGGGTKMLMETAGILDQFERFTAKFARAAVEAAVARREDITPELLRVLEDTVNRASQLDAEGRGLSLALGRMSSRIHLRRPEAPLGRKRAIRRSGCRKQFDEKVTIGPSATQEQLWTM